MELIFEKKDKFYECAITVEEKFNLHIEKAKRSGLFFYIRTSEEGGEYFLAHCFNTEEVFEKDFSFKVYPKNVILKSAVKIDKAYITFGKKKEDEKEEGGGGSDTPTPLDDPYYVGSLTATKAQFTALSDAELLSCLNEATETPSSFKCTENCFVLLVPKGKDLACSYTSSGLTTHIMDDEWDLVHDDITIDGTTFKVYGYRFSGVSEIDPLTYDFNIK